MDGSLKSKHKQEKYLNSKMKIYRSSDFENNL